MKMHTRLTHFYVLNTGSASFRRTILTIFTVDSCSQVFCFYEGEKSIYFFHYITTEHYIALCRTLWHCGVESHVANCVQY